jgi:hypothetical protein
MGCATRQRDIAAVHLAGLVPTAPLMQHVDVWGAKNVGMAHATKLLGIVSASRDGQGSTALYSWHQGASTTRSAGTACAMRHPGYASAVMGGRAPDARPSALGAAPWMRSAAGLAMEAASRGHVCARLDGLGLSARCAWREGTVGAAVRSAGARATAPGTGGAMGLWGRARVWRGGRGRCARLTRWSSAAVTQSVVMGSAMRQLGIASVMLGGRGTIARSCTLEGAQATWIVATGDATRHRPNAAVSLDGLVSIAPSQLAVCATATQSAGMGTAIYHREAACVRQDGLGPTALDSRAQDA